MEGINWIEVLGFFATVIIAVVGCVIWVTNAFKTQDKEIDEKHNELNTKLDNKFNDLNDKVTSVKDDTKEDIKQRDTNLYENKINPMGDRILNLENRVGSHDSDLTEIKNDLKDINDKLSNVVTKKDQEEFGARMICQLSSEIHAMNVQTELRFAQAELKSKEGK